MNYRTSKPSLCVYFVLLLFCVPNAFCQLPCQPPTGVDCTDCAKNNYVYQGCLNGKSTSYCTNNPNGIPGFNPHKMSSLTCCYDGTNAPNKVTNNIGTIFDPADVDAAVCNAVDSWNDIATELCLCSQSGPTCQICVKWATTSDQLGRNDGALAVEMNNYVPSTCAVNCTNLIILLNNIQGEDNQFSTEELASNAYDLNSVLMHEIGHAFGFGDFTPNCPSGASTNDIMYENLSPGTFKEFFQPDDMCAYELLYCCSPLGINEYDPNENLGNNSLVLSNAPNPFNDKTTINYTVNSDAYVSVKVYNSLGTQVAILQDGRLAPGNYSIPFSGVMLPAGIYYYVLLEGAQQATRGMLRVK